ncbi:hypothetical protein ARMSODRAFT_938665 [Armillaria solidipes]|uniref:Fungal pheromone STE3G-protein-coupled receptor n=1 Tax=Armillaria solidipes TaxID=1076256 RepID=A0A2H3BV54_9AGAR|nr:hypothetical protein ARMSODRAFT_938665 [Armillaria solidipes]
MTDTDGLRVLYYTIRLICQTLVYGIYTILMPICSYIMLKRGLRGKSRILLFCMLIFMFSLSTAYWILSLYHDVHLITTSFVHGVSSDDAASTYILQEGMPLVNALVLLNYVSTDGVVVWRAWVLCQDGYSKSLILPLMFLCMTLSSVMVTIGLRVAITVIRVRQHIVIAHRGISRALDYFQVANLVLSLLTNIFSTSIVGIKAWHHRHWVTSELQLRRRNTTTAERILALLVESGIIYCFSAITVLIATVIRLPFGTLGDVYTPVNVQFAGIYPTIVLILVSRQGELNESVMFTDQDKSNTQERAQDVSNLDTIEFGDNPHVNSSFGETQTFADVTHHESMVSHLRLSVAGPL